MIKKTDNTKKENIFKKIQHDYYICFVINQTQYGQLKKKNQFPVQKKNIGKRPQQKDKQRESDQDSSRSGKNQLSIRQTSLAIGITLGSFHSPRSKIQRLKEASLPTYEFCTIKNETQAETRVSKTILKKSNKV